MPAISLQTNAISSSSSSLNDTEMKSPGHQQHSRKSSDDYEKNTNNETDRQTDGQTDRETERAGAANKMQVGSQQSVHIYVHRYEHA